MGDIKMAYASTKELGRADANDECVIPATRSYEVLSIVSGEDDFLLDRRSYDDNRPADSHARLSTMLAINTASILEKTDEQLLPSVYKYVGCSFHNATPGAPLYRSWFRSLVPAHSISYELISRLR